MLFQTPQFFLFLAVVLILFYSAPQAWRKFILLAASYYFYMSWNPDFIAAAADPDRDRLRRGVVDRTRCLAGSAEGCSWSSVWRRIWVCWGFSNTTIFSATISRCCCVRPPHSFALSHHPAAGNQLSHLPKHVLCDRCVSRPTETHSQIRSITRCSSPSSRNLWPDPIVRGAGILRRLVCLAHRTANRRLRGVLLLLVLGLAKKIGLRRPVRADRRRLFRDAGQRIPGMLPAWTGTGRLRAPDLFRFLGLLPTWPSAWRCCSGSISR